MPVSRNRNSVPSNSWIGNLPNFITSSRPRKSSFSRPTYQSSRPPSPPKLSAQQFSYPAATQFEDHLGGSRVPSQGLPVKDYRYQEPVYSSIADVRSSVPVTEIFEKDVCDQGSCWSWYNIVTFSLVFTLDIIRRSKSGRLPSVISHLNGADDTMDSRISAGEEHYSNIPENVFFTPLKHSTQDVRSVFQCLSSRQYRSDQFSTLPAGTVPQLQSTPQEPQHQPRLNIYANVPEEFPSVSSPRPAYQNQSLQRFSPSVRKNNFLYASHRAVPGSSPFVSSVKVTGQNSFSINKVGLPNTLKETPGEDNNSRQYYSQENSDVI